MEYIAIDVHKRYSLVRVEDAAGALIEERRLEHAKGVFRDYLGRRPAGSPVAVETTGNWYWVVDEIEEAGQVPRLTNAFLAKRMIAGVHKSDRLDCRGLNRLQRSGTLPTVWIAPAAMRDRRALPRSRMALVGMRTTLKNRVHGMLARYAVTVAASDVFGRRARAALEAALAELPEQTAFAADALVAEIDALEAEIARLDAHIAAVFAPSEETRLLRTVPGVGPVLSVVMLAEIGAVARFARPAALASYAGLVPTLRASGDKTRFGRTPRRQISRTLKWAFIEAANAALLADARAKRDSHVRALYRRIKARRGHGKAVVAVARHLAEAAHVVLSRRSPYRDPATAAQG